MFKIIVTLVVMVSVMSFCSYAEINIELKKSAENAFKEDLELNKAVFDYMNSYDKLYEGELYKQKEKFKEQFLKYIKSESCAFFLLGLKSLKCLVK